MVSLAYAKHNTVCRHAERSDMHGLVIVGTERKNIKEAEELRGERTHFSGMICVSYRESLISVGRMLLA